MCIAGRGCRSDRFDITLLAEPRSAGRLPVYAMARPLPGAEPAVIRKDHLDVILAFHLFERLNASSDIESDMVIETVWSSLRGYHQACSPYRTRGKARGSPQPSRVDRHRRGRAGTGVRPMRCKPRAA